MITLDRDSRIPLYRQIAEQLKEEIASGRLPAGTRLPTVRRLAADLSVTRLTVQNAYAELQSSGWLDATVGRGTFVSMQAPTRLHWSSVGERATPAGVIGDILQMGQTQSMHSMASASPDPALFPEAEFWSCMEEQRPHTALVAGYGPAQGDAVLRIELAAYLAERGIRAAPEEVLVVAGVTQGVALAAQALAQPGECVLVEQPTYVGFLHLLRAHGLNPIPVAVDAQGPRLDLVEQAAIEQRIRFMYTIPSFQNPTGCCMPSERRARLLELAERFDFYVVEDDLYGLVAYDAPPPTPLRALPGADDRVLYVTSFSKTLMPGLRLGMLVAPAALRERLTSLRIAADLGSPLLLQRTLAAFLHRGEFRRHLRRIIPLYRERRTAALRAMEAYMPPSIQWTRPEGGFCFWLTLPHHPGIEETPRLALQQGWAVAPGSVFLTGPDRDYHLRLCFGSLPVENLRRGIETLSQIVRERLAVRSPAPAALGEWMPFV